jgi:hypothetical protein
VDSESVSRSETDVKNVQLALTQRDAHICRAAPDMRPEMRQLCIDDARGRLRCAAAGLSRCAARDVCGASLGVTSRAATRAAQPVGFVEKFTLGASCAAAVALKYPRGLAPVMRAVSTVGNWRMYALYVSTAWL